MCLTIVVLRGGKTTGQSFLKLSHGAVAQKAQIKRADAQWLCFDVVQVVEDLRFNSGAIKLVCVELIINAPVLCMCEQVTGPRNMLIPQASNPLSSRNANWHKIKPYHQGAFILNSFKS